MDKIIMVTYGAAVVLALIIIIVLIFRRMKIRKRETFEKRDN